MVPKSLEMHCELLYVFLAGLSNETIKFLEDQNISYEVIDYLQTELQMQLRKNIAPQFWKWFKKDNNKDHDGNMCDNDDTFINAVRELHTSVSKLFIFVDRMDQLLAHFHQVKTYFGIT